MVQPHNGHLCCCPKHRHPVLGEWRTPGAKRPKLGGVCCMGEARAPEIRQGYFWSQVRWNRSSTSCPIPVRTRHRGRGTLVILQSQVTYLFHRKPRVPDSTRLWKLRCSFALERELGNLSGAPNGMFLPHLQQKFCARQFEWFCGDLWTSSTVQTGFSHIYSEAHQGCKGT